MTVIGLVRHGVTDWNTERRTQGQSDIPLNEIGLQQARMLAERFRREEPNWDLIVTSDLSRARVTAETIGRALGIRVESDTRLRERNSGLTEGLTFAEKVVKWGEGWQSLQLGIEDEETLGRRGSEVLRMLANTYPGSRLLVVSHGGLLRSALRVLVPDRLESSFKLSNTSYTRLAFENQAWQCDLLNCTKHLGSNGNLALYEE